MIPILRGRFQVRAFLTLFVAVPITAILGAILDVPGWVLGMGLVFAIAYGYFMDVVCNFIQQKRWDRDWPPVLFLMSGAMEFVLLLATMRMVLPFDLFSSAIVTLHFWSIWIVSYVFIQHIFHPFRPLYKYSGAQLIRQNGHPKI